MIQELFNNRNNSEQVKCIVNRIFKKNLIFILLTNFYFISCSNTNKSKNMQNNESLNDILNNALNLFDENETNENQSNEVVINSEQKENKSNEIIINNEEKDEKVVNPYTLKELIIKEKKGNNFNESKPFYYLSLHGINNPSYRLAKGDKYILSFCQDISELNLGPFREGEISVFNSLFDQSDCLYKSLKKYFKNNLKNKNLIARCFSQGFFGLKALIPLAKEGLNVLAILQNCPISGSELIDKQIIINVKKLLGTELEPTGFSDLAQGSKFINTLNENLLNINNKEISGSFKIFNMCSYLPEKNKIAFQNFLSNIRSPFMEMMLYSNKNQQNNSEYDELKCMLNILKNPKIDILLDKNIQHDCLCTLKSQIGNIPQKLLFKEIFKIEACHESLEYLMIPNELKMLLMPIFQNIKTIVDDPVYLELITKIIKEWQLNINDNIK
ncbi:MAG: hypothetical protein GY830_11405 [Bacteroidetes bacterium]|nr:hypothetical protein [Bacteroidota bacterium]